MLTFGFRRIETYGPLGRVVTFFTTWSTIERTTAPTARSTELSLSCVCESISNIEHSNSWSFHSCYILSGSQPIEGPPMCLNLNEARSIDDRMMDRADQP